VPLPPIAGTVGHLPAHDRSGVYFRERPTALTSGVKEQNQLSPLPCVDPRISGLVSSTGDLCCGPNPPAAATGAFGAGVIVVTAPTNCGATPRLAAQRGRDVRRNRQSPRR